MMLIQVNTDGNVLGQEKLLKQVRVVVTNALTHLRGEVDRVEMAHCLTPTVNSRPSIRF